MPTYDYACSQCGYRWEAEQRITEPPLEACPKCLGKTAKRQISGGGAFILKGGGWYADLYSSPKKPASDTANGSTTGETSKSGAKGASESASAASSSTSSSSSSSASASSA